MIYFIQAGKKGPIKIGRAVDVESRLKQLQTGNHKQLKVLFTVFGHEFRERNIQKALTPFEYRKGSEWFRNCPEVLEYLNFVQYPDYEVIDGKAYAILWRDKGATGTEPCPFCGEQHYPGEGEGHRVANCRHSPEYLTAKDGTILRKDKGYILRTR